MNLLICVFSIYGCRPRILVAIKCVQPETRARRRTPPIYVAIMFRRPVRNQYTFSGPFLLHESKNTNPLSGMWHGNWDFLDSNFCCARLFRLLVVFDVGRVLFGWFWSLVENHLNLPYIWTSLDSGGLYLVYLPILFGMYLFQKLPRINQRNGPNLSPSATPRRGRARVPAQSTSSNCSSPHFRQQTRDIRYSRICVRPINTQGQCDSKWWLFLVSECSRTTWKCNIHGLLFFWFFGVRVGFFAVIGWVWGQRCKSEKRVSLPVYCVFSLCPPKYFRSYCSSGIRWR